MSKIDPQKEIENFTNNQNECSHTKGFTFGAQQVIPNMIKGVAILLNTVMCTKCGKQFVQSIETGISIGKTINPFIK